MSLRRKSISLFLALGLCLCAPLSAQAQTPTPTYGLTPTPRTYSGYFWLGEQLTGGGAITTTTPSSQAVGTGYCNAYAAYAVAAITVIEGTDGTVGSHTVWYNLAGNSQGTYYRYSDSKGRMIYIVINNYFSIPDDVLNTVISAYTSTTAGTEVYVDAIDVAPSARISWHVNLVTATAGRIFGFDVLCYKPAEATATPTITPTPLDIYRTTLTSGSELRLDRHISYGDIAVVTVILVVLLFYLLKNMMRIPKLWN